MFGVADENLPHRPGGEREEMPTVDQRQPLALDQLEVGLVHQRRRVEGERRSTEAQLRACQPLQLGVQAIEDRVERALVPFPQRRQQQGDLAGRPLAGFHSRGMIAPPCCGDDGRIPQPLGRPDDDGHELPSARFHRESGKNRTEIGRFEEKRPVWRVEGLAGRPISRAGASATRRWCRRSRTSWSDRSRVWRVSPDGARSRDRSPHRAGRD
jgi:hypothetical protein